MDVWLTPTPHLPSPYTPPHTLTPLSSLFYELGGWMWMRSRHEQRKGKSLKIPFSALCFLLN